MPRFSIAAAGAMSVGDQRIYPNALLFEAGSYPDKDIEVSQEDLAAMASKFNGAVDLNLEHMTTELTDDPEFGALTALKGVFGNCDAIWVDPEDPNKLRGRVTVPAWLDERLESKGVSAEIAFEDKSFQGLALTYTPRVKAAALMGAAAQFSGKSDDELSALIAEFAKKTLQTPHGQRKLQSLHDMAAESGARCSMDSLEADGDLAAFTGPAEAKAFQAMHDAAVAAGAKCRSDAQTPRLPYYYSTSRPSRFDNREDERKPRKMDPRVLLAKFAELIGLKAEDAEATTKPEAQPAAPAAPAADNAEIAKLSERQKALEDALKTEQEALKAERDANFSAKVEQSVDKAIADLKFTPAMRDSMILLGKANFSALEGAIANASPIVGTPTPVKSTGNAEMSEERRKELLETTPLGRTLLAVKGK